MAQWQWSRRTPLAGGHELADSLGAGGCELGDSLTVLRESDNTVYWFCELLGSQSVYFADCP